MISISALKNSTITKAALRASAFNRFLYQVAKYKRQKWIIKKLSAATAVPFLSFKDLSSQKNSETLVVLGSGASVNLLSEGQWRWIRSKDSIGLNFWPMHSFVPTYLTFEIPTDPARREALLGLYRNRASDLSESVVMLHQHFHSHPEDIKLLGAHLKNFFLVKYFKISDDSSLHEYKKLLRFYSFFYRIGVLKCPAETRASLFRAVSLAAHLGYSKVILVGIDLNNTKYFWDNWEDAGVHSGQSGAAHKTILPVHGEVTIDKALHLASNMLFQKLGVDIVVSNPHSHLTKYFPSFEIPSIS